MNELIIPPHNIEAEQSVLGALLLSSNVWDKIADKVSETDFYRAEHQLIYRHIARHIEQGKSIDVIVIAESLQSTGKLDRVGGLQYLGELSTNTPSVANIASYASIVRTKKLERDFMAALYDIQELSYSEFSISDKISKAVDLLQAISDGGSNEPIRLSTSISNALEGIERRFASDGEHSGLKTGFNDFDRKLGGLQPGDLIIIAGRPSQGKTAFAINIAENVVKAGGAGLVFSIEMSDEQLALRAISSAGSIDMNILRTGKLQDNDWDKLTHSITLLNDANLFIDQSPMITSAQMHAKARRMKRQHGLDLIVIDYLQLMSEGGDNRNAELASITRKLKLMAKDLGVPVVCLSQLSRKCEERTNKRPLMSDLRDSGAIEQDADVIVMLYRDEYYNPDTMNKGMAEAIICKNRMGEVGMVPLTFQGKYSRFNTFSGEIFREEKRSKRGFDDGKTRASGFDE